MADNDKGNVGYWQSIGLTAIVIAVLLICSFVFRPRTIEVPPTATALEQVSTSVGVGTNYQLTVSTDSAFSAERPAPPVDSVVITNGEEQLKNLMARRKQTATTNEAGQVINR